MTVFIAHAPVDAAVAEALEKFLERRGQFVEADDGQTALRPIQASDVLILLVSKDLVFAPMRLRLEQRALDAWADGRLIVVKLDHGIAPVGLRDLPAIDASFEAQREFKWQEVANAMRDKLRAAPTAPAGETRTAPKPPGRSGGWLAVLFHVLLALPGLAALAVAVSIYLVNRIGPTPGGWPELLAGVDAFGMRYGATVGLTVWVFASAIALTVLVMLLLLARIFRGPAKRVAPAPAAEAEAPASAPPVSQAVFVSYARANSALVLPVVEGAQQQGRKFWLDQQGISAGDSWAGEIVRAIKSAAGVVVMCSKAAFESDHVKREIYLADRYQRRLIPVFVEEAEPPEDFEYFFAGVQHLKLFETPEAERADALARAVGAGA